MLLTTQFFKQLLDELNQHTSDAQFRRVLFVYGFSILSIVLLPLLALVYLALDAERLRWLAAVYVAIAVLVAGNLLWLHRHRNIALAENLKLLMLFIVLGIGLFVSLEQTGPYWLSVFPPIAMFLKGLRIGLLACGVLIASLILIAALQHWDIVQTVMSTAGLMMLIGSLATLTGIVALSRAILADTEARLEKRSNELSREILERHSVESLLRKSEARIRFMAHRDAVTALPNRALCYDRLEQALQFAQRHHHKVAVLLFDVDDFSGINDRYGTECADLALREIGQRLRGRLRAYDTVGRVGVDEFLIILPEVESAARAEDMAAELVQVIAEPVTVAGETLSLFTTAGAAVFPLDADQPAALIEVADARLFAARRRRSDTELASEHPVAP